MIKWGTHFWYQRRLGFLCGLRWSLANAADRRGLVHEAVSFRPRCLRHPVSVRMGPSSDVDLFRDIFLSGGMDFWRTNISRPPQVIVDLGANVGFTGSFFLSLFPSAFVLAVEPDPASFEICKRTLARYGDRAKVVEGAAWHSCGQLTLSRGTFRDGREWATEAYAPAPGVTGNVTAFDMPALLAMCPRNEIDILKIDIEGSEKALFSENTGAWLPYVHNICIETHGTDCAETVAAALAPYRCRTGQTGEYELYLDIGA